MADLRLPNTQAAQLGGGLNLGPSAIPEVLEQAGGLAKDFAGGALSGVKRFLLEGSPRIRAERAQAQKDEIRDNIDGFKKLQEAAKHISEFTDEAAQTRAADAFDAQLAGAPGVQETFRALVRANSVARKDFGQLAQDNRGVARMFLIGQGMSGEEARNTLDVVVQDEDRKDIPRILKENGPRIEQLRIDAPELFEKFQGKGHFTGREFQEMCDTVGVPLEDCDVMRRNPDRFNIDVDSPALAEFKKEEKIRTQEAKELRKFQQATPLTTTVRNVTVPQANEFKGFREAQVAADSFFGMAQKTIDIFQGRPEVLGLPAGFAQLSNSLRVQSQGFVNLLGGSYEITEDGKTRTATADELIARVTETSAEDLNRILTRFKVSAIDSARIKSAVVGMAFAAASASGAGEGRAISDRDVKLFVQRIGESPDPDIFEAVLKDLSEEFALKLESRHRILQQSTGQTIPFGDPRANFPKLFGGKPRSGGGFGEMSTTELLTLDDSRLTEEERIELEAEIDSR